jgi:hypothetical protein
MQTAMLIGILYVTFRHVVSSRIRGLAAHER